MKLRLLSAVFALGVALAACNTNNSKSSPSAVESPASPTAQASVSPAPQASGSESTDVATTPSDWYAYSSPEGKYAAKFPQKPTEQKKSANSGQGPIGYTEVSYIDQAKQRIFLTGHTDIPVPAGAKVGNIDVEKGLDGGRDGMVKAMGATIEKETKITQNGYSGREITMKLPKGISAKARIFINSKNLKAYQVIVGAKDGNVDFPEAQAFLGSVKFE